VPPFARARSVERSRARVSGIIVAEESEEHDGALDRRRDLAVDELSGGQASPLSSGSLTCGVRGPMGSPCQSLCPPIGI